LKLSIGGLFKVLLVFISLFSFFGFGGLILEEKAGFPVVKYAVYTGGVLSISGLIFDLTWPKDYSFSLFFTTFLDTS